MAPETQHHISFSITHLIPFRTRLALGFGAQTTCKTIVTIDRQLQKILAPPISNDLWEILRINPIHKCVGRARNGKCTRSISKSKQYASEEIAKNIQYSRLSPDELRQQVEYLAGYQLCSDHQDQRAKTVGNWIWLLAMTREMKMAADFSEDKSPEAIICSEHKSNDHDLCGTGETSQHRHDNS